MKAYISEIFSSIQGEGVWVGLPQIFVRFQGCRLKCDYCDTPQAQMERGEARIEREPLSGLFQTRSCEFSPEELTDVIQKYHLTSLALTGGEPLEQADFLRAWLEELDGRYKILLETNGVETGSLSKVLPFVDMLSVDLKIPSATGGEALWEKHERFLSLAMSRPCYGKVVFDERITGDEIEHLMMIMSRYKDLPVVFQPVWPLQKRDMSRCLEVFHIFSEKYLDRVRLIPQMHKLLSIR